MTLAQPQDLPAAFASAWMARDAAALAALFTEDADFVNVVGIWWKNRKAIETAHDYALQSFFSQSRLTPGRVKVRRLGDSVAVVHARMTLSGQLDRNGAPSGQRTTILSFVLTQTGDGWLCVSAQNTDVVPGAETFEATTNGLAPRDYRA
jgi:uncharacterized protein (TIGR02246 family)